MADQLAYLIRPICPIRVQSRMKGESLPGAALGCIAKLDNPVRTGKQFCPHPTEVYRFAPINGHENKLVGETGES